MKTVAARKLRVAGFERRVSDRRANRGARARRYGCRIALGVWAALMIAGCATPPKPPPATPRSGGYYQNDGPPAEVPADLARVPDAVPRVEPLHPFANRPYVALGRTYVPNTADLAFRQRGFASWYGRQFHGNRTSSGEIYDMFAMTAAHPTLPIPSYVRVTNVKSGASVIVRVNDRGPFKDDRIIDLSFAAATRLGFAGAGTAEVEVERFTRADIASGRCCERTLLAQAPAPAPPATVEPIAAAMPVGEPASPSASPLADALPVSSAQPQEYAAPAAAPPAPAEAGPTRGVAAAARWSVQLGAFSQAANADALRDQVAQQLLRAGPSVGGNGAAEGAVENAPRVERHGSIFRVLIGDLVDRGTALQLARRLEPILNRETTLISR